MVRSGNMLSVASDIFAFDQQSSSLHSPYPDHVFNVKLQLSIDLSHEFVIRSGRVAFRNLSFVGVLDKLQRSGGELSRLLKSLAVKNNDKHFLSSVGFQETIVTEYVTRSATLMTYAYLNQVALLPGNSAAAQCNHRATHGRRKDFFQGGRATVAKLTFANSKLREKHFFCTKELIGKCQISKSRGVLAPCPPFRRPWGHWRIKEKISLKTAPARLAPTKVFGMLEWFWYAWVILARLSSFDMREWFWHAWKLLTCKSDFGWKRQTSSAKC